MPLTVSVSADFERALAAVDAVRTKQLPFATVLALNDAAMEARKKVVAAMPTIFDRPTSFTLNSVGVRTATKSNLTAEVFIKKLQAQYLGIEETGGDRTPATNTRKPGAAALVMPELKNVSLNAYGNLQAGFVARLFKQIDERRDYTGKQYTRKFGSTFRVGYEAGRAKRDKGIFYLLGHGIGGSGPGGVFKRLPDHHIQRLISFEAQTHYTARFAFQVRAALAARQTFRPALMRHLRELKGA